jgi:hypothetical protein
LDTSIDLSLKYERLIENQESSTKELQFMSIRHLSLRFFLILTVLPFFTTPTSAQVITSPSGGYQVGIDGNFGNLYDGPSGIGFLRVADGYDPIAPGTPREAWGIAAGSISGYADTQNFGTSNLVINGSANFLANSASISHFLNTGSSNLLQIDQNYTFAANNVLQIQTKVTNVSGSNQAVLFSRNVDWDIAPTPFNELTRLPALTGSVVNASFYGFESPDPLVPFGNTGTGVFGPGDLGAGILIDLGSLADGQSISFNIFHALGDPGQSENDLINQLAGLGSEFTITGFDSGANGPTNFAALGFGLVAVPEPTTVALCGLVIGGGAVGYWRRRYRNQKALDARFKRAKA